MNIQVLARKPKKIVFYMLINLMISLVWWYLAIASNHPARPNFSLSLLIVLGGFLPASFGIAILYRLMRVKETKLNLSLWAILAFNAYPILTTLFYFSRIMVDQPVRTMEWLNHPVFLVINLMAVLLIGPAADSFGLKTWATETLKAKSPTNLGKHIVIFIWWIWHLPFIFLNGSALRALGFSNGFLGAYLLTILMVSYLLSWGYDRKQRLVLFTAYKHF
jgi:hypothetical protein